MWKKLSKNIYLEIKKYEEIIEGSKVLLFLFLVFLPVTSSSNGLEKFSLKSSSVKDWSNCSNKSCHGKMLEKKYIHPVIEGGGCESCHTTEGKHPFKKLIEEGNKLCLLCHDSPVKEGEKAHPAVSEGSCTDCHSPHSSQSPKILKEKIPELCYECHDRKDKKMYVHSAVLLGRCLRCHKSHSSPYSSLLTQKDGRDVCFVCHYDDLSNRKYIHPHLTQGGVCTDCHDPHQSDFENNLHSGLPQLCYECHESKSEGKVVHQPVKDGKCTTCHNPHGTDLPFMLYSPINELCSSCHKDKSDGTHIFTGFAQKFHPVSGDRDPKREGKPFSCTSCHNPHSSDNLKLFYEGKDKRDMCRRCHAF